MKQFSRRRFLGTAAVGAAALTFPIRRVLGANETLNMGFIGVGGRGAHSAGWFSGTKEARVAAVCDADEKIMNGQKEKYAGSKAYLDLRKLIEDKDIDAVCISTCNHWHALAAIWAMQAGKDVYVEKPVSQTVWEGRKMVEAARKYNRICQGGTQQRSDPVQAQIHELIKSEKLGKMQWIRGNRYGTRLGIGKRAEPLKPPASVNYDLWLGPAQDEPIFRKDFHYDWHWSWNTGSGEMGNWGVHILDDIRNMLFDKCTLPTRILAGGGRLAWNDAGETPNTHFVYFDTGVVPVIFSLSNLPRNAIVPPKPGEAEKPGPADAYRNIRDGYVIQFENGYYAGGRGGGASFDQSGKRLQSFKANAGSGGEPHAKNFIDAVKSRNSKIQKAEIEQTHYSSAWCHLANIAYRLGAAYNPQDVKDQYKAFAPWQELVDGFEKHFQIHGAKPGDIKVSAILEIDPAKEVFSGPSATPAAQKLLTREYRKGYEVPERV